jgi:regulator of protease activity HflC (stomatin/prohibitin superfamily)
MNRETESFGRGIWIGGIAVVVGVLVVAILGLNWITAFKSTSPGSVCVVQEGGPFDGRGVAEVRPGGEGVNNIGIFNKQRCFPATQRNYIVSANAAESDSKTVDQVQVPTLDAVNVGVEGQALFTLNTDPRVIKAFYTKYAVRTFDGLHPYEGDDGWVNFLRLSFRPILDNALREAIGNFRCVELNNTCQYVQNAEAAVKGDTQEVNNNQNLVKAQSEIERTLQADLSSTLGGEFFTNIRFRLRGIKFAEGVQHQIDEAQAKRTAVATAKLEADRRVAEAKGNTLVAQEQAEQIRIKAESYSKSKAQAEIDKIKAFCGADGCDPQVVGGNFLNTIAPK